MVGCCSVKLYCVLCVKCVLIGSQDSATDISSLSFVRSTQMRTLPSFGYDYNASAPVCWF